MLVYQYIIGTSTVPVKVAVVQVPAKSSLAVSLRRESSMMIDDMQTIFSPEDRVQRPAALVDRLSYHTSLVSRSLPLRVPACISFPRRWGLPRPIRSLCFTHSASLLASHAFTIMSHEP